MVYGTRILAFVFFRLLYYITLLYYKIPHIDVYEGVHFHSTIQSDIYYAMNGQETHVILLHSNQRTLPVSTHEHQLSAGKTCVELVGMTIGISQIGKAVNNVQSD